jgi:hypothetical protein
LQPKGDPKQKNRKLFAAAAAKNAFQKLILRESSLNAAVVVVAAADCKSHLPHGAPALLSYHKSSCFSHCRSAFCNDRLKEKAHHDINLAAAAAKYIFCVW